MSGNREQLRRPVGWRKAKLANFTIAIAIKPMEVGEQRVRFWEPMELARLLRQHSGKFATCDVQPQRSVVSLRSGEYELQLSSTFMTLRLGSEGCQLPSWEIIEDLARASSEIDGLRPGSRLFLLEGWLLPIRSDQVQRFLRYEVRSTEFNIDSEPFIFTGILQDDDAYVRLQVESVFEVDDQQSEGVAITVARGVCLRDSFGWGELRDCFIKNLLRNYEALAGLLRQEAVLWLEPIYAV